MPNYTELDKRMKGYENVNKTVLTKRTPVILRIDGKAFHTFTRGMDKPFDKILIGAMQDTMKYLCEHIQGCKFGYVQSDEISLLLEDYDTLKTCAWFDNEVNKINSIGASMATLEFNRRFKALADEYEGNCAFLYETMGLCEEGTKEANLCKVYATAISKGALFDCRCFNLPKEEVCNYFIWRQQDATRNSILSVGYANFSSKSLENMNTSQIQEKLWQEKNLNWNDLSTVEKRGTGCYKIPKSVDGAKEPRMVWEIDTEMPILTQDRQYIEKYVFI